MNEQYLTEKFSEEELENEELQKESEEKQCDSLTASDLCLIDEILLLESRVINITKERKEIIKNLRHKIHNTLEKIKVIIE